MGSRWMCYYCWSSTFLTPTSTVLIALPKKHRHAMIVALWRLEPAIHRLHFSRQNNSATSVFYLLRAKKKGGCKIRMTRWPLTKVCLGLITEVVLKWNWLLYVLSLHGQSTSPCKCWWSTVSVAHTVFFSRWYWFHRWSVCSALWSSLPQGQTGVCTRLYSLNKCGV